MDNDLNFPLKLSSHAAELRKRRVPIAIFACGTRKGYGYCAKGIFSRILREASFISVRADSCRNTLEGMIPALRGRVRVTPDPALWADAVYQLRRPRRPRTVGLGIAAPETLSRGSEGYGSDSSRLFRFWSRVVMGLYGAGFDVELFVNGAEIDARFAGLVAQRIASDYDPGTARCPPAVQVPRSPQELTEIIGSYGGIIAHRLHALIVATSLDVPWVGLTWDQKVAAFAEQSGRKKYALSPKQWDDGREVVRVLLAAMEEKIDRAVVESLKRRTQADIREMLRAVGGLRESSV